MASANFVAAFAESKEPIGGFAIRDSSGTDEAPSLCETHAAILGSTLAIGVRLVDQTEDAAKSTAQI